MLVLPVLAAFATSLMVARVGLIIADFPEFSENTLAGKSGESSNLPGGGLMPSPQPSPTGEGANKTATGLPFCFYLHRTQRNFNAAVLRFAFRRAVAGDRVSRTHAAGADAVRFYAW